MKSVRMCFFSIEGISKDVPGSGVILLPPVGHLVQPTTCSVIQQGSHGMSTRTRRAGSIRVVGCRQVPSACKVLPGIGPEWYRARPGLVGTVPKSQKDSVDAAAYSAPGLLSHSRHAQHDSPRILDVHRSAIIMDITIGRSCHRNAQYLCPVVRHPRLLSTTTAQSPKR